MSAASPSSTSSINTDTRRETQEPLYTPIKAITAFAIIAIGLAAIILSGHGLSQSWSSDGNSSHANHLLGLASMFGLMAGFGITGYGVKKLLNGT